MPLVEIYLNEIIRDSCKGFSKIKMFIIMLFITVKSVNKIYNKGRVVKYILLYPFDRLLCYHHKSCS